MDSSKINALRTDDIAVLVDNLVANSAYTFIANLPNFREGPDADFHLIDYSIQRPQDTLNEEQRANGPLNNFYARHGIDPLTTTNTYYRWCSGPTEYNWALNQQLEVSRNHRANKILKGVSVAEGPWLYHKPHTHLYFLEGDVLERGPDGEPLLDVRKARVATDLLTKRDLLNAFRVRNEPRIIELSRSFSIETSDLFTFLLGNI